MACKPRTGRHRGRGIQADGRSERQGESFVRLPHRLLSCPAFLLLSLPAKVTLVALLSRWRGDPATNGAIPFAARDATPWGVRRTAAAAALVELAAFGFIRCCEESNLIGRRSRRWACSELPTMDAAGREVSPTFAARRLSSAEAARVSDTLRAAARVDRARRDPGADGRLEKCALRPRVRTQLSAGADAKSQKPVLKVVASGPADANAHFEPTLRPDPRTVLRSTRVPRVSVPLAAPADGSAAAVRDAEP
jgi:hypothetical protein